MEKLILTGTRVLVDTGQRSNILVIFSDGEEFSSGLEEAAKTAVDSGVFVYALGFGTKAGDFIPGDIPEQPFFFDRNNNRVQSRLNEESLTMIAKISDGFYSRGIGPTFLRKLDNAIQEMDRFEEEGKHQRVAKPAYQWFLFGGILFLMASLGTSLFPASLCDCGRYWHSFFSQHPRPRPIPSLMVEAALREGDAMRAHSLFTEAAEQTSGDRAVPHPLWQRGRQPFRLRDGVRQQIRLVRPSLVTIATSSNRHITLLPPVFFT